jgi:F0F1-type ATP synthase assembly protein I
MIRKNEEHESEAAKRRADGEPTIDQGVYYLSMIIGLQVLFVFGIMGVIMFIGKVISTPGWIFMIIFLLFAASVIYIYRKARKQLKRISELFSKADRNYEISIMGGMLTMRIEQNSNVPKLLEAPLSASVEPVIDAETKEAVPAQERAHLS